MYLEASDRQEFAQGIVDAVIEKEGDTSLESNIADTFIENFSKLEGLHIEASHVWMDLVISWVKSRPSEMLAMIKANYRDPKPILQKIIEYKKPY